VGLVLTLVLSLDWPEPDPELWEAERFPTYDQCERNLEFAQAHLIWLEQCYALQSYNRRHLEEWLWEARACRDSWCLIRDAKNDGYPECTRREWLRELRERIGRQNFAAGYVGPAAPLWRFHVLD